MVTPQRQQFDVVPGVRLRALRVRVVTSTKGPDNAPCTDVLLEDHADGLSHPIHNVNHLAPIAEI